MPINPNRKSQGGDVEGQAPTDSQWSVGNPISVSKASFDPGYPLDATLSDADIKVSKADLVQGYCTYGKVIGE